MTKIHTIITEKTLTDDFLGAYKELDDKVNKINSDVYYTIYIKKKHFRLYLSHDILHPILLIDTKNIKEFIKAIIREHNTVDSDVLRGRFGGTNFGRLGEEVGSSESIEEETSEEITSEITNSSSTTED